MSSFIGLEIKALVLEYFRHLYVCNQALRLLEGMSLGCFNSSTSFCVNLAEIFLYSVLIGFLELLLDWLYQFL